MKNFTAYTDGSHKDGVGGIGVTLKDDSTGKEYTLAKSLAKATVNLAEITAIATAIKGALNLCLTTDTDPQECDITIYSDSKWAVNAVTLGQVKIPHYRQIAGSIRNDLAKFRHGDLRWVKAHVGHQANHVVDQLAKKGREAGQ